MASAFLAFSANAQELKTCQNYDFVSGSKLIFSDDFSDSEAGEPGVHWKLAEGGGMNMIEKAFTDGKYISHSINFAVNSAVIRPESAGEINTIVKILKENTALKVEIGGHTDSDGNDDSNLKLSSQRAQAVKDQLMASGIAANRFTIKGYGEIKPVADNTTFEGKAQNRRVEFIKIPCVMLQQKPRAPE